MVSALEESTPQPVGATARPSDTELLQSIGQAVIATDPEGRIFFWNAAAEELYGWPAAEVMGLDIAEVTVPQMSKEAAADVMEALHEGRPWSGGFPVQRRDGEVLHALVTDSGIYRDGELIGIVGISLNLGSAVRHLMERSTDAAVLLDEDLVVTYASPAVDRLFGWPVEEVQGAPLTERINPEDHERFGELLDAVDEETGVGEVRVRSHGDWAWVEVAVTHLYAELHRRSVVCNIRRSERLTRLEERERVIEAVHSDVLQDLFAASLQIDRALPRTTPTLRPRLEHALDGIGRAMRTLRDVVLS